MNHNVLLVDDDVSLLSSVRRNLALTYDVTTAESGAEALELLRSHGRFSVIMTDMRMPHMDGLQLIDEARRIAPDSIYLMLTGNQDLQTAKKAVNDGHVFRFLNKPCEIAEIKQALDAAIQQYALQQAERELLQKTFLGAVNVLSDVVDLLQADAFQQAPEIDAVMRACEESLGFHGNWQFRLAARVGLVGFVLQPVDQQRQFHTLSPDDPESRELFNLILSTSARLIERIPRLEPVVAIIRATPSEPALVTDAGGFYPTPELGNLLLRVATYWTILGASGRTPFQAITDLVRAYPSLPGQLLDALLELGCARPAFHPQAVELNDLQEGMVLFDNALAEDGSVVLRKGRKLTAAFIEKLKLSGRRFRPMLIIQPSHDESTHLALANR